MLVILCLLKKQKGNIRQGYVGGDTVSQEKMPFTNLLGLSEFELTMWCPQKLIRIIFL